MEHTFKIKRVKQYNSTHKYILMIDNEPVAICRSEDRVADLVGYVNGADVDIADGKIKKILDGYRK